MSMVKSDGNGAVIVDKKLFWLIGWIMGALLTISLFGANATVTSLNTGVDELRKGLSQNEAGDAGQEKRIILLEKQFERIDAKLDRLLEKRTP